MVEGDNFKGEDLILEPKVWIFPDFKMMSNF